MGCRPVKLKESYTTCKDDAWWYSSDKKEFYFRIVNERGQFTTLIFDTTNLNTHDNKEFIRYYFFKDIHIECNIDYTITTDSIYNGQRTKKFLLKINRFYPAPNSIL